MKAIPFVLMALGFGVIVAMTLTARSGRPKPAIVARTPVARPAPRTVTNTPPEIVDTLSYDPVDNPVSTAEASRAIREASVKSNYIGYRNAVSSGNRRIREKLLTALKKDEELALRVAQEDLDRTISQIERKSILETIEAIRR